VADDKLSLAGIRILWANRPRETLSNQLIPCFPSAELKAYSLTRSEVNFLMTGLSPFYTKVLDGLSRVVANAIGADRESSRIILRESVVLISYVLVDRILRLNKVLVQEGATGLGVANQNGVSLPKTNAHLLGLVDGSQEFNQYLLLRLASSIWNLAALKVDRPLLSDVRNATPISNLNFDHPGILTRIKRKIYRILSAHLGRFPALRLANIEAALLDKGLYGMGKLMWPYPLLSDGVHDRKLSLRKQLLLQLSEEIGGTVCDELFLQQVGLNESDAKRAKEIFFELLLELIPPDRLEGIPHYLTCERNLKSLAAPALFFCGMPSDEEIHWVAAARKLRIPVIGVQHGVHYGFTNQACFVETELAYCDYFMSWGWDQFPMHPLCQDIRAIALPSPWLSERAKTWRRVPSLRLNGRAERPHDVLLMSDRIQAFPPTVSTLRMSRLDFLGQLNSAISGIVSELAQRRIRVLNKPYNYTSRDMQATVLDRLTADFPGYYCEYERLDKGLSVKLLQSAWIVLWDEPGTGFFECLVGGIPSMVYWERLTSREEDYARPYFERLEAVGLLHASPSTMAVAVEQFLSDPEVWLADEERSAVIREVTDRFSKTDDDWSKQWAEALKFLANDLVRA